MHEYTVAYDIYATARRAAIENSAQAVKKVCVDVGELSMVNPEQVKFLFETICREDPCFSDTVMEFTPVAVKSVCSCGYEGSEKYVCPLCGKLPEIVNGREICVKNIEIEVDET